jgi:hypothetical protein
MHVVILWHLRLLLFILWRHLQLLYFLYENIFGSLYIILWRHIRFLILLLWRHFQLPLHYTMEALSAPYTFIITCHKGSVGRQKRRRCDFKTYRIHVRTRNLPVQTITTMSALVKTVHVRTCHLTVRAALVQKQEKNVRTFHTKK